MQRGSGLNRRRESPGGSVTECRPACPPGGAGKRAEARGAASSTVLGELADLEDGRLLSENNLLDQAWMPGSFMCQTWWEVRKQSKKTV